MFTKNIRIPLANFLSPGSVSVIVKTNSVILFSKIFLTMKDAVIISGCVIFLVLSIRQTKALGEWVQRKLIWTLFYNVFITESCLTPNKDQGECKPIKSCKPILTIIRKKPISDSERMFLRRSQCGNIERLPWVCCPNEKVSTQMPRTSSSLQLNPSVCGRVNQQIPNRIFGGSETRIGEFPWWIFISMN